METSKLTIEEIYARLSSVIAALPLQTAVRTHRASKQMLLARFESNREADNAGARRQERDSSSPHEGSHDGGEGNGGGSESSGSSDDEYTGEDSNIQVGNVGAAEGGKVQIMDAVPRSRKAANKRALKEAVAAQKQRASAMAAAAKGDRTAMESIVEREYDIATRRAAGEKVRDDPARIRKSIRNSQSKRPRKSAKKTKGGKDAKGTASSGPAQKPSFPIKSQTGFGRSQHPPGGP